MFLLHAMVLWVSLGPSVGVRREEMCYGKKFTFPAKYTPPLFQGQLYFTPTDGGPRKLMLDNEGAKDPRLKTLYGQGLALTDLRVSDAGTFTAHDRWRTDFEDIVLKIIDCADTVKVSYGKSKTFVISRETEYVEFSPYHLQDQTQVLWNRSDSQANEGGRVNMKDWSWEIVKLTQEDNGYYNFRKKDNTLVSRKKLYVQENSEDYDIDVSEELRISSPLFDAASWTVTFTPNRESSQTLLKAGKLLTEVDWFLSNFAGRVRVDSNGIEIKSVRLSDTGTFQFRDAQDNLALTARVNVMEEYEPSPIYSFAISMAVMGVIVAACCCLCGCTKKSKRDESATEPAPAAACHNDQGSGSVGGPTSAPPPYSLHPPMYSSAPSEPAATPVRTAMYKPVNIHVNPLPPEVADPAEQEVAPAASVDSDPGFVDTDPKFELKGLTFPSAPPLSSDATSSDVYTSDKINFL